MTVFIAFLVLLVVVVLWRGLRVMGRVDAAPHGRMSERWLAQHRASAQG